MISIKDLLAVLDKWPTWKRITESPARIDALEARIAALESAAQKPADTNLGRCQHCGSRNLKVVGTAISEEIARGALGLRDNKCQCLDCGGISLIEPPDDKG